jgi:hypothetical protein
MDISHLNGYPLHKFRTLFASLPVPEPNSIRGKYRGAFVGPAWVRASVKPALWIAGLSGWWGKEFYDDGTAINIVLRRGQFLTRFPMEFTRERSFIDGKEGVALHYQKSDPFPLPLIVDEIRRLDGVTLLGITRPNIPGLRWLALPFILQKQN